MKPQIIFSDFDGTLTEHTEFSSKFLDILKLSSSHNIPFIIVTGRSLSWAHFFLTHFKILDYVISEGGGVISYKDARGLIVDEFQVDEIELLELENFSKDLKARFPSVKLSADSLGRVSDRAIELCDLNDPKLKDEITNLMNERKVNFSTSNVHLNFWRGELSKFSAVEVLMDKFFNDISLKDTIFFGDSLNDQTMFKNLEHSVGVSNISSVIDQMDDHPKVILKGPKNIGPLGVLNYLKTLLE